MTDRPGKPDDLRKRAEQAALTPDTTKAMLPDELRQTLHDLQVHRIELEMQNEELRRAQEELEASRERYFDLYDLAPVGYFTLSKGGLILEANLMAARLLGMERKALIKRAFFRFVLPENQDLYHRYTKELFATGGPEWCELKLERQGGDRFWVRLEATAAETDDGGPVYRTVMSDITLQKQAEEALKSETAMRQQAEERLHQAQKMEAIGTLAGGIAHDFNNMLGAIIGFSEMAIDDNTPGNKPVDHALKNVLKAAFRARDLVRQILAFSRKTHQEIIPLSLAPLVKETAKLLRATLPSNTEIVVKIKSASDTVLANPAQIQQVVMNLCTNAGFAMREKSGKITITIRDAFGSHSALPADLEPRPYILLSVRDTGTGIEPGIINRIFEPFFTTKEQGEGTGMGLAVSYGIVKSLHGDITVESELGKGSIFNVFIPQAEPSVQLDEIALGEIPHGTERILFVDDEEALVEWGRTSLRRLGYKVVGVTDSQDALSLFLDNPRRFDLVITDRAMPTMTGLDLAKKLTDATPDIPIILCTGLSDMALSQEAVKEMGI